MTSSTLGSVLFGVGAIAAFVAKCALEQPSLRPRQPRPALLPLQASYQGESLRRFAFGQESMLADLVWVQLLQKASSDPLTDNRVSWEYAQLDAITRLDRRFDRAFRFGATFLSVLRRDKLGARALLERWVRLEPALWRSHYTLGYHLYFEMNDSAAAAPHILRAASMEGAPGWLGALAVRLTSETGALLSALRISLDLYSDLPSALSRERLRQRILSLRYTIQKVAWEKALENYREKWNREPPSLSSLEKYVEGDLRTLASVEGEIPEDLAGVMAETFPFRYDRKSRKILPMNPDTAKELEQTGIYRDRS